VDQSSHASLASKLSTGKRNLPILTWDGDLMQSGFEVDMIGIDDEGTKSDGILNWDEINNKALP